VSYKAQPQEVEFLPPSLFRGNATEWGVFRRKTNQIKNCPVFLAKKLKVLNNQFCMEFICKIFHCVLRIFTSSLL